MSCTLKSQIISFLTVYSANDLPVIGELVEYVKQIPDEKFPVDRQPSSTVEHVMFLLDEILFVINKHHTIEKELGEELDKIMKEIKRFLLGNLYEGQQLREKVSILESRLQALENDKNEKQKLRSIAELLAPVVRQIRTSMTNEGIPDSYYCRTIMNAYLLRANNKNISWEIADFNAVNPYTQFNFHKFNQLEELIRTFTYSLHTDFRILIGLLSMKLERNEQEHDSIKNFFRSNPNDLSFNSYLQVMGLKDMFSVGQKICLEAIYRQYFRDYYNRIIHEDNDQHH